MGVQQDTYGIKSLNISKQLLPATYYKQTLLNNFLGSLRKRSHWQRTTRMQAYSTSLQYAMQMLFSHYYIIIFSWFGNISWNQTYVNTIKPNYQDRTKIIQAKKKNIFLHRETEMKLKLTLTIWPVSCVHLWIGNSK